MDALDGVILEHLVALKVCELCGKLYGQKPGGSQYCVACEIELRDFPAIGSRKLRGRKPAKFLAKPSLEAANEAL